MSISPPDDDWPEKYAVYQYIYTTDKSILSFVTCLEHNEKYFMQSLKKCVKETEFEVQIYRNFSHPSIAKPIEIFETPAYYNIIMKMPIGHLLDYLRDHQRFSEFLAQNLAYDIIRGLEYLHQNGVCHGSVSLESILLSSQSASVIDALLYDFHLSFLIDQPPPLNYFSQNLYSAPEQYCDSVPNEKIDIYALGVVFYMVLTGNNPFKGMDQLDITMLKALENFNFTGSEWNFVSQDAAQMVQAMLTADPDMRPSASQCLAFQWMAKFDLSNDNIGSSNIDNADDILVSPLLPITEVDEDLNDFENRELEPINGAYF